MEGTQKVESSESYERKTPKKYLGRNLEPDFEDGERLTYPRGLKRSNAIIDLVEDADKYDGMLALDDLQDKAKYTHKDFPIDLSSSDSDLELKPMREAMNNVIVFDRSLSPDVLWYLGNWCITPDAQIQILRSAASYLSRTNGHVNKRGKYKRDHNKK